MSFLDKCGMPLAMHRGWSGRALFCAHVGVERMLRIGKGAAQGLGGRLENGPGGAVEHESEAPGGARSCVI